MTRQKIVENVQRNLEIHARMNAMALETYF